MTVDGRDQTRYLSRNKHGPDAEVVGRHVVLDQGGSDLVLASVRSHEYTPVHTRAVLFIRRQYVVVLDRVDSSDGDAEAHDAELAWHLPDDATVSLLPVPAGEGWTGMTVDGAPAQMLLAAPESSDVRVDEGWVSVLYGVKTPAPVLRAAMRGTGPLVAVSVLAPRGSGVALEGITRRGDGWVVRTVSDGRARVDLVRWPAGAAPYSSEPSVADLLQEGLEPA